MRKSSTSLRGGSTLTVRSSSLPQRAGDEALQGTSRSSRGAHPADSPNGTCGMRARSEGMERAKRPGEAMALEQSRCTPRLYFGLLSTRPSGCNNAKARPLSLSHRRPSLCYRRNTFLLSYPRVLRTSMLWPARTVGYPAPETTTAGCPILSRKDTCQGW